MNVKELFLDVYDGIYFRERRALGESDRQTVNLSFFFTFFTYYASLFLLLIGIRVVIYGPFKPSVPGILFLSFGVYGLIYWYFIRPHRNTGEIDEGMDKALVEKKKRTSIYVQAGGMICIILVFVIVYVLYEIFDPNTMR